MQHHAYFVEGPLALLDELAAHARALFTFEGSNNPDVSVQGYEKFGIDDAHALRSLASFKSISNRALFVVGIGSITSEAQQALLKLFEEPQEGTMFVLLVPHGVLLPTLRSRLMEYPAETSRFGGQNSLVESVETTRGLFEQQISTFLKSSYKTRSATITALLKDDEGAKERVRELLAGLELELYVRLRKSNIKEMREALEDIAQVRSYVADRSPSLKMLLEHLAATLPQA